MDGCNEKARRDPDRFCRVIVFQAPTVGQDPIGLEEDRDDKVLVWPDLVYTELLCLILATAGLMLWAIISKAPLEQPANPGYAPNPAKAPWYFLGLQEMLDGSESGGSGNSDGPAATPIGPAREECSSVLSHVRSLC